MTRLEKSIIQFHCRLVIIDLIYHIPYHIMLMFVVRKYKYSFSADKHWVPLQLRDADRVNILNDDLILYLKLCRVSRVGYQMCPHRRPKYTPLFILFYLYGFYTWCGCKMNIEFRYLQNITSSSIWPCL